MHCHRFLLNNSPWIWRTHPFGPTKGWEAASQEGALFPGKLWAALQSSRTLMGAWWKTRARIPALGCWATGRVLCKKPLCGQVACPGARGSRGHAAHPGAPPGREPTLAASSQPHPLHHATAPHGQIPPAGKAVGLCSSSPDHKKTTLAPNLGNMWNPRMEVVGFSRFCRAECSASWHSSFWLALPQEDSSDSHQPELLSVVLQQSFLLAEERLCTYSWHVHSK